jgi:hypothetical protein
MINITDPTTNPYTAAIRQWIAQLIPTALPTSGELLDAVYTAVVATSQTRFGPAPSIESAAEMRRRMKLAITEGRPIPILSPWGSKKPIDGRTVDVAELVALHTLIALSDRVRHVYPPGIVVQLGIEDLGGEYLWKGDTNAITDSRQYVRDLVALVRAMDQPWLMAVPESTLAPASVFEAKADQMQIPIMAYLDAVYVSHADGSAALAALQAQGWRGDLPEIMVSFYMGQYERLYPSYTYTQRLLVLATYLAQSWARYEVRAKLADPTWEGKYVQINFPLLIPGMPAALADYRVHYRTIQLKDARTHMPPWRGFGYLCIDNANNVTPKIVTPRDYAALPITEHTIVISGRNEAVRVHVPYVLR